MGIGGRKEGSGKEKNSITRGAVGDDWRERCCVGDVGLCVCITANYENRLSCLVSK